MRILFATAHFGFLRNFESSIGALARRGHDIVLSHDRGERLGGQIIADRLIGANATIRTVRAPKRGGDRWNALGRGVRLSRDYLRYLHPYYDDSPELRGRARRQVPKWLATLTGLPGFGSKLGIRSLDRLLETIERSIPINPRVMEFVAEVAPDLVLVTPLLYFGSDQVDFVRAARSLGIRTVLGVGSWDHLTTKGLIHEVPDLVLVWNEMQRVEAKLWHGVPPDRVLSTGAQAYDHWFARGPSTTKGEFCQKVGLDGGRPLILYLCSSPFIAPGEREFVLEWARAIRSATDPNVAKASLLVRPHPQNAEQWERFSAPPGAEFVLYPPAGANPIEADSRCDYFDSMYHSSAVVGLNTSGMIEAGIVGRPVHTVLQHPFAATQTGTLHFRHLAEVNGGLLHISLDLPEHVRGLTDALQSTDDPDPRSRAFVEAFVRPRGLDKPAAELFADAIEELARSGNVSPIGRPPRLAGVWRVLLAPLALALRWGSRR